MFSENVFCLGKIMKKKSCHDLILSMVFRGWVLGFFLMLFFFVSLFGFYDRNHQKIMLTEPDLLY